MNHYSDIVVGAGQAGVALAASLSRDPRRYVLLADAWGRQSYSAELIPGRQIHIAGKKATCEALEELRSLRNIEIAGDLLVNQVVVRSGQAMAITEEGGRVLRADRVTLCAGAIGTAAILLRSGIGPARALRDLGIPVVADLPGVGQNLRDNPECPIEVPGSTLFATLPHPDSTGSLVLTSADPRVKPKIELNLLSQPEDLRRMREATRLTCEEASRRYRVEALTRTILEDDDELDEFLFSRMTTRCQPVGTAKMGADRMSVVDGRCRVNTISGLRVADASILPTTRTNTMRTWTKIATQVATWLTTET